MTLYEQLADDIAEQIRRGVLREGDRLQSVREASRQRSLSITTVLRAYLLLESRGLLQSRPQSGYFVRGAAAAAEAPLSLPQPLAAVSADVDVSRLVLSTLRSIATRDALPLGSPYPDAAAFPSERLNRYLYEAGQATPPGLAEALPPGHSRLIRQIARRHLDQGLVVDPAEIVVTCGATEAINLCLQAVARPGAVIAVESPTFYAMLHAIERLGMKAVELPTDPREGLDLDALAAVTAAQPVAACMVMPNFQNPLGFAMPEARKRALVKFAAQAGMPIIENGVYNELYYGDAPPGTLKVHDREGLVLHCGSFTKSLSPAYRIGWALPGRYRDTVEKLKFLNTLATPALPQLAIARFLERGSYERHLRGLRRRHAQQARMMRALVSRFFPEGTRLSDPAGGYVLWVELPPAVDAMKLYEQCLARGITIGPGHMFSVSGRWRNCIRLNYSAPWSREIEKAVITIGRLASDLLAQLS